MDEPADPASATRISIRNESGSVRYLLPYVVDPCYEAEIVHLGTDAEPGPLPFRSPLDNGCWNGAEWKAPSYCGQDCIGPFSQASVAVAPGATYEIEWDGRIWMPWDPAADGCSGSGVCELEEESFWGCRIARPLAQGTAYAVAVRSTPTCPAELASECDCPAGVCPISDVSAAPDDAEVDEASGAVGQPLEIVIGAGGP